MNFFGGGKRKVKTAALVDSLLDQIFDDKLRPNADLFNLSSDKQEAFYSKVDFYKQATLLRAVIIESLTNTSWVKAKEQLERILFQASSQEEGMVIVQEMKAAMLSIEQLVDKYKTSDGVPVLWSRGWLTDIGIDSNNPVSLAQFCWFWAEFIASVAKTLSQVKPV